MTDNGGYLSPDTGRKTFYLGTHEHYWLYRPGPPLFVSTRRLERRKRYRPAQRDWALDSGAFTELSTYGRFLTSPAEYVDRIRTYQDQIGRLRWAAPQDWMCEPFIAGLTGLDVIDHQARTVDNFLELRSLAPDLPIIPVLQGFTADEYWDCLDRYLDNGVNLQDEPLIGLGTVCRRQHTGEILDIASTLWGAGFRLHGFGVKTLGLAMCARYLQSADSLAWSYNARRNPPIIGHSHINCGNCEEWASRWRDNALADLDGWGDI